jgi:hypothetical protein
MSFMFSLLPDETGRACFLENPIPKSCHQLLKRLILLFFVVFIQVSSLWSVVVPALNTQPIEKSSPDSSFESSMNSE